MFARCSAALLLIIASVLFSLSWLREEWSIAIWGGTVLFLILVPRKTYAASVLMSVAYGMIGMGLSFYWATNTLSYCLNIEGASYVPAIVFGVLLIWESFPFAMMGWAIVIQHRRFGVRWFAPMVWVVFEAFWPRVFPWSLAHSQTKFIPILQAAELGGTCLVSFIILYACFGIATLARTEDRIRFRSESLLAIGLAIVAIVGGWFRISSLEGIVPEKTLRIGIVQIDPSFVESTERMRAASDAMEGPIDLYVWPESTIGAYSTEVHSLKEMVKDIAVARMPFVKKEFAENLPGWLLVGGKSFSPETPEEGPYWQTAFLIDPDGKIECQYRKRHLIPVGEFVPLEKHFPMFHEWAQLSEYFETGTSDDPVCIPNGPRIGALICYEDLIESAARRTTMQGAQVLVGLINASAFETTEALEQHRRLSLMRTIENRRCYVRCAGTGVSCFIDQFGREQKRLAPMEQGHFVVEVPLLATTTLYQLGGHLLPWGMLLLVVTWPFLGKRLVDSSQPTAPAA